MCMRDEGKCKSLVLQDKCNIEIFLSPAGIAGNWLNFDIFLFFQYIHSAGIIHRVSFFVILFPQ